MPFDALAARTVANRNHDLTFAQAGNRCGNRMVNASHHRTPGDDSADIGRIQNTESWAGKVVLFVSPSAATIFQIRTHSLLIAIGEPVSPVKCESDSRLYRYSYLTLSMARTDRANTRTRNDLAR